MIYEVVTSEGRVVELPEQAWRQFPSEVRRVIEGDSAWASVNAVERQLHSSDGSVIVLHRREELVRQWKPAPGEIIALNGGERIVFDSGYCSLIYKRPASLADFFRG